MESGNLPVVKEDEVKRGHSFVSEQLNKHMVGHRKFQFSNA